jgi:hypothetical protein
MRQVDGVLTSYRRTGKRPGVLLRLCTAGLPISETSRGVGFMDDRPRQVDELPRAVHSLTFV